MTKQFNVRAGRHLRSRSGAIDAGIGHVQGDQLENAALTERFTGSADGVLWLTSSTSPAQVQELDELTRELHRAKPLLPVVTRSDLFEEDEVDGKLVKCLGNKTAQNRAQQEEDVTARAEEKLARMGVDVEQLKLADASMAECGVSIAGLMDGAARMEDVLRVSEKRLLELETELRAGARPA